MRQHSKTVCIARPISTVFAFLADPGNDRLWRREVTQVTRTTDPGTRPTYAQTVAMRNGRHGELLVEITELVPDTRIAFAATSGSLRRIGSYDLRAIDNGTEVTLRLSASLVGLQRLMAPLLTLAMESHLDALEELERVLESRTEL